MISDKCVRIRIPSCHLYCSPLAALPVLNAGFTPTGSAERKVSLINNAKRNAYEKNWGFILVTGLFGAFMLLSAIPDVIVVPDGVEFVPINLAIRNTYHFWEQQNIGRYRYTDSRISRNTRIDVCWLVL